MEMGKRRSYSPNRRHFMKIHWIVQASIEHITLHLQPPKCWDHKCVPHIGLGALSPLPNEVDVIRKRTVENGDSSERGWIGSYLGAIGLVHVNYLW